MSNRVSSAPKKSPRPSSSRAPQAPGSRTNVRQGSMRSPSSRPGSPRQLKAKQNSPHHSPKQEAQNSCYASVCCCCPKDPTNFYACVICSVLLVVIVIILLAVVLSLHLIPDTFNQRCVERHNYYRDWHHSPPLYYNATLARAAQDWTITMSRLMNVMTDPDNFDTGENVGEMDDTGDPYTPIKGEEVADYFYSQSSRYDYYNPEMSTGCCFEFTQMVWRHTTQVGCGYNVSRGQIFFSCRYFPRGNIPGQYRDNVLERVPQAHHPNTTDRIKAIHLNFTEITETTPHTK